MTPWPRFAEWYREIYERDQYDANVMVISTVSETHAPTSRVVLFRGIQSQTIQFFTNYESRKARDISENPNVSICFAWHKYQRQIIVEGVATKVSDERSDEYFRSRPRENQIGAHASRQSFVISDRRELMDAYESVKQKYEGLNVPRPAHWGGYAVAPSRFEFWSQGDGRLHDRQIFDKENDEWIFKRLSP